MRLFLVVSAFLGFMMTVRFDASTSGPANASLPADSRTSQDCYTLSRDVKNPNEAPTIVFTHRAHSRENYNQAGNGPIACVECHHTDLPAGDLAKLGGVYKTAYPAGRKDMLTDDLYARAPGAPEVIACRGCHAQKGAAPRVMLAAYMNETPGVTYEGDDAPVVLDNEEAYHRNCNACHDAVSASGRRLLKGKLPTWRQCTECHTGKTLSTGKRSNPLLRSMLGLPRESPADSNSVTCQPTGETTAAGASANAPREAGGAGKRGLIRLGVYRSREDSLREVADALISNNRLGEARQALDLLKQEEHRNFLNREFEEVAPSDRSPLMTPVAFPGRLAQLMPAELQWKGRYARVRGELAAIGVERRALRAKASRTVEEEQRLDQLEGDLRAAGAAYQELVTQLFNELGGSGDATARIFNVQESKGLMQDLKELGHGAVALYTLVGRERYRVILITPDVTLWGESPITAEELAKKVTSFREALQDRSAESPLRQAQELYDILLRPVASQLKDARAKTLMWSLDGVLRYLPPAALHDGQGYLAQTYLNTVYTPASLARLKDAPSDDWSGLGLGVSAAVGGFPALPAVEEELRAVIRQKGVRTEGGVISGERILNREFTVRAMETALRRNPRVVHIASHFQLTAGAAADSYLLMGDGSRLSLDWINTSASLFEGVELLALSACNTATPEREANGREVEGLGVIAQEQGAKAVIASLWNVADQSTSVLMKEFYRLRVTAPRLSKAEALRQAQLLLLQGQTEGVEKGKRRGLDIPANAGSPYSHPFYWAPFVLIGNWK